MRVLCALFCKKNDNNSSYNYAPTVERGKIQTMRISAKEYAQAMSVATDDELCNEYSYVLEVLAQAMYSLEWPEEESCSYWSDDYPEAREHKQVLAKELASRGFCLS